MTTTDKPSVHEAALKKASSYIENMGNWLIRDANGGTIENYDGIAAMAVTTYLRALLNDERTVRALTLALGQYGWTECCATKAVQAMKDRVGV